MFKKKLRKINKNVKIKFFFTVYPKIKKIIKANKEKDVKIKKVKRPSKSPYSFPLAVSAVIYQRSLVFCIISKRLPKIRQPEA